MRKFQAKIGTKKLILKLIKRELIIMRQVMRKDGLENLTHS